jgi:hypothetical protein
VGEIEDHLVHKLIYADGPGDSDQCDIRRKEFVHQVVAIELAYSFMAYAAVITGT